MDYLIAFEDGSRAVLTHHGVKGQKWRKWNEETAARYAKDGKSNPSISGGGYSNEDEEDASQKEVDEYSEEAKKIVEGRKYQPTVTETVADAASKVRLEDLVSGGNSKKLAGLISALYEATPISSAAGEAGKRVVESLSSTEQNVRATQRIHALSESVSESAKERKREEKRARDQIASEIAERNQKEHSGDVGWYADRIFNSGGKMATSEEVDAEIERRKKRGEWRY